MKKRSSNIISFRLNAELRDLLGVAAAREKTTVSELLQRLVKHLVDPADAAPAPQSYAAVPSRMLLVERRFGLDVIDSASSLKDFGIESVRDLASPDKLLLVDAEGLNTFAAWYELQPDWLTTGRGGPFRSTHQVFDLDDVLSRVKTLSSENKLRGVVILFERHPDDPDPNSRVIVALERAHPAETLTEHTVYESWCPVAWPEVGLGRLVRAGAAWSNAAQGPWLALTLGPMTFDDLCCGRILLPEALREPLDTWSLVADM